MIFRIQEKSLWIIHIGVEIILKGLVKKQMGCENEYVSGLVKEKSKRAMQMVLDGRIRCHKLGGNGQIHYGEVEERETENYIRFLRTRNFYDVMHIVGFA